MLTRPLVPLPWHAAAHHLVAAARAGDDALFLVGPPGTGKTEVVMQHVRATVDAQEARPTAARGGAEAGRAMQYVLLGRVVAPAGLLTGILGAARQPVSARLRRKGTTYLLDHVADWLAKKDVGALVLDEVQHASSEALFHAMLLMDTCARTYAHRLGLVLIGTPNAAAVVRETGQMGQRVAIEFAVPLLTPEEIGAVCAARASYAAMERGTGKRRAEALMHDVVQGAAGSIRRLMDVLDRADRYAAGEGVRLAEHHVRLALDLQAE